MACGSYQLQGNFCQCSLTTPTNKQLTATSSPGARTSRWGWEWEMGLLDGMAYAWDNLTGSSLILSQASDSGRLGGHGHALSWAPDGDWNVGLHDRNPVLS